MVPDAEAIQQHASQEAPGAAELLRDATM